MNPSQILMRLPYEDFRKDWQAPIFKKLELINWAAMEQIYAGIDVSPMSQLINAVYINNTPLHWVLATFKRIGKDIQRIPLFHDLTLNNG